jgi:hypothetical protein
MAGAATDASQARPGGGELLATASRAVRERTSQAAPWVALPVAALLVTYAYSWAASHTTGTQQFTLFWVGLFVYVIPLAHRLARPAISRDEQLLLLVVTALFFFLPKVLRSPSGPIYADEIAQWRQSQVLHDTGHLFKPNPFISVVNGYPGLHALTDVLRQFSGLSTWGVAVLLIALFMSLAVVGVYQLAELVLGPERHRAAGFAGLIYACSSGYMFFDSQYAYESMGLPMMIWLMVSLAQVLRPQRTQRERTTWLAFAGLLLVSLIITHHLTAIALDVFLVVTAITAIVQRRRGVPLDDDRFRDTLAIAVCGVVLTVIWALFAAPRLAHYLGPQLTNGISELSGILKQQGEGSRQLFAGATSPSYEHLAAFAAPALVAVLVLVGLLVLLVRRPARPSPMPIAIVVLGLLYFPSVPFILTPAGAEGARRSWDFSYVGVALLAALGIATLLDPPARSYLGIPARWIGRLVGLVLPLGLCLVLLGNVAAGLNVEYRFPGPYVFGSDTRSLTAEHRGAVAWFDQTQGINNHIIADRQDGIAFGSLGINWTERAYGALPLWDFYFQIQRPDRGLFETISRIPDRFLIVDRRIARFVPGTGVYVVGDEPGAHNHVHPPPVAAIAKYDVTPWTTRVYSSTNLSVLRLDYPALGLCTDVAPEPGTSFASCPGHRR